jgi:hypothetical protein
LPVCRRPQKQTPGEHTTGESKIATSQDLKFLPDMEKPAMNEAISPLAGKPAPREMLVDLNQLEREYYTASLTWPIRINW